MAVASDAIAAVFQPGGTLAKALPQFQPRQAQQQMAEAIAKTMTAAKPLVVEAETGTGKTFAYLAPVLLQTGKVIISTGTKNLQEQLFHRDLPLLRDTLAPKKTAALLKGRANYLCIHRMQQAAESPEHYRPEVAKQLIAVQRWSHSTRSGDLGELNQLPENAEVLPQVTSTVDNCLGRDCPNYEDCYVVKARKEALEADIVVVNHHLFFADMALKDVGFGELIPEAQTVVFDEAHQLPDIASQYFGEAVSSRQLQDMLLELQQLCATELKDLGQANQLAQVIQQQLRDWRLAFPLDPMRGQWREWKSKDDIATLAARLSERLAQLESVIGAALGRSQDLDNLYERFQLYQQRWQQLQDTDRTGYSFWFETTPRHVVLHQTPLSVAERFRQYMEKQKIHWVFTSATLAMGEDFSHFTSRLGLEDAQTLRLTSPFDYPNQALLCLPRYLPPPSSKQMLDSLLPVAERLIAHNHGGTFLLFTSHRMLNLVANGLRERLSRPLFVQGESTKRELLEQFVASQNGVLLGTASFWEGVDVQGEALRCVVIDKLPFVSPDDPLLMARVEDARRRGVNPFATIQLPEAVIALKQGAGRLIRDSNDRGVLVVCDHRLVTKAYGELFLRSLPPMRRTRDIEQAYQFLEEK
ncbi:ATP-dependent helicase [Idiomarina tyrosinivorans]|uniref:DNA 5'-3' helicase n=1 Tax=Idiomarina tyrosinivorans TaxID=1445662 RepID=A0A432ZLA0_9GAMM|nr:ATP-dependent DNA helicase [Idiomarina tyrosinivorans]RUO78748.1 ATP-dependent helicase [Idiomarina tyrosinivorans]